MKNKIRNVLILAFLVFISFYYGGEVKKNVSTLSNALLDTFYDLQSSAKENISKHFNQAEQIQMLKAQNESLKEASALVSTFANQLNLLLEDKNSTQYLPKVALVKAISYVDTGNYNRVWLYSNASFVDPTQAKGLIYQGYSAGIAISKEGRSMALLQGDEQCVFAVYIGRNKIPGILQGNNGKVVVKFIPRWDEIKEGDQIFTSGLDGVFFSGVPVGVISKVIAEDAYQSAEIKPFVEAKIPAYMYMVQSL